MGKLIKGLFKLQEVPAQCLYHGEHRKRIMGHPELLKKAQSFMKITRDILNLHLQRTYTPTIKGRNWWNRTIKIMFIPTRDMEIMTTKINTQSKLLKFRETTYLEDNMDIITTKRALANSRIISNKAKTVIDKSKSIIIK